MSAPVDAQPLRHFQKVYNDHVNAGVFLPLGDAYHFYQWMLANQYWSAAAESYDHVGYWIKRGLIVARFEYQAFADLSGKSTKTVARYLDRIEELGFGVVLQEGGFIRGDDGRAPFVVAIGAWSRASDGSRTPHYVGWTNALNGTDGHITVDELAAHVASLAERGAKARGHLAAAREKWAKTKEAYINEELPGKTNLSSRKKVPGKTNLSSRGKTDLSSRGKTNLSSVNLEGNTQIASTQITDSAPSLRSVAGAAGKRKVASPEMIAKARGMGALKEVKVEAAPVAPKAEAPRKLTIAEKAALRQQELAAKQASASEANLSATSVATPEAAKAPGKKTRAKASGRHDSAELTAMKTALAEACFPRDDDGALLPLTSSEWGYVNKVANEFLEARRTPEDVLAVAALMEKNHFWSGKVSLPNLVKQYPEFLKELRKKRAASKPAPKAAPGPAPEAVSPETQARIDELNRLAEEEAAETRRKMGLNR